jgi:hypothetical protein
VDKGTKLEVELQSFQGARLADFKASFNEASSHVHLSATGDELYDYCLNPQPDTKLYIAFFREQQKYSFEGRLVNAEIKHGEKIVNIVMLSAIKVESRRGVKRFEIYTKVNILTVVNGQKGVLLGDGESNDVSLDALSFSSNVDINKNDERRYGLEFTLFNKHPFFLPIKILVKRGASVVSKTDYDYVVLFDFDDHPHEKKRLTNAFFNELSR